MTAPPGSTIAAERPASALTFDAPSEVGVLLLHGITGSPAAWRPIAEQLIADGTAVRVPLLPGHGTVWQDLNAATWADWRTAAARELADLRGRHSAVVVAGLSMGGALALELAAAAPAGDREGALGEIFGLVLVNPALRVDSPLRTALPLLQHLVPSVAAIGNDIELPDQDEVAYPRTPLRAIASMQRGQRSLLQRLWRITVPTVICQSGTDNVVGPWSARQLRARLAGPVRTVSLRRSRHVATLDYDASLVLTEIRRMRDAAADSPRSRP
ncbi:MULTISPECIES: carboxylesterase [Brevibacterium]|mgnify:CR=1 FL=1|uniref:Alpha/beta fold hydrolase n=1 Tax=Brevibacterium pityocampae TaxID=506594 RepID=A0ABP8JCG4_9MICO|nr:MULTISPECIES: alpha/beta fold hydrolase [unclassified Brevibacterium]MCK1802374.1 alpha/beta fold hydrolase [Brevibacterium sp. R8603A2]QCP05723.1 alpha/beta fold hydrolase [Brevibacterium sp. CS2]